VKKALVAALVLTFVLSIAATASAAVLPAAPFTDVAGHAAADTLTKLYNLGVFKGDPSGTVRPNDPVTRAEFCAVVVRAMGLETAAKYSATPTKFADVGPEKAWAWGYINVAVAKGVIKGYDDGGFHPDDPVTYAQAVTMLARAIGYVDLPGDWPANYIMVAVSEGLTNNATFDAPAPATRGDLAFMTWNTMNAEMVQMQKTGDVVTYTKFSQVPGGTPKYLRPGTAVSGKIVVKTGDVSVTGEADLKADEIKLDDNNIYKLPAGVDGKALLGHQVHLLYKTVGSDKVVVYLEDVTSASSIVTGTVTAVSGTSPNLTVKKTGATTTTGYDWASSPVVFRNKVDATTAAVAVNDQVTLFLDSDGKVRFASAFAVTNPSTVIAGVHVKGVDGATANEVDFGSGYVLVADNATILKNGSPATLSQIAKDQIADICVVSGKIFYLSASDVKVTGVLSNVVEKTGGAVYVTVGGKEYKLSTGAQARLDNGAWATATPAVLAAYVGFNTTLSLNPAGDARLVDAKSTAIVGILKDFDTTAKTVKVDVKGSEVTFTYLATATGTGLLVDANKGVLPMVVKTNSEGKVTEFIDATPTATGYTVEAVDTASNKVTVSTGTPKVYSVLTFSADAGLKINGQWATVSALKVNDTLGYFTVGTSVFYAAATRTGTATVYGKYTGYLRDVINKKTSIFVDVAGTAKQFDNTDAAGAPAAPSVATGTFVKVTLDAAGEWTAVDPLTDTGVLGGKVVAVGSDGSITIERTGPTYAVINIKDLPVYDKDGNVTTTAAVVVGKTVKFWDDAGTIKIVQLTD